MESYLWRGVKIRLPPHRQRDTVDSPPVATA